MLIRILSTYLKISYILEIIKKNECNLKFLQYEQRYRLSHKVLHYALQAILQLPLQLGAKVLDRRFEAIFAAFQ